MDHLWNAQVMPLKAVVLLSGGLDSLTALADLLAQPLTKVERVHALIFDYGQSSKAEVVKAATVCQAWHVPYTIENLNLQEDTDTRVEIPARNLIFLAHAARFALNLGFNAVALGAEPDSTYTDSSVEFSRRVNKLMQLFGLEVLLPVKFLENKLGLLRRALDLGVPLHLAHSSRSNAVDGACKTSSLFLASLQSLFPRIAPISLLEELAFLQQETQGRAVYVWYATSPMQSFKYAAALFTVASHPAMQIEGAIPIFTTGSWGVSLRHAANRLGIPPHRLDVQAARSTSQLLSQVLNCDSTAGQWGIKQAMSMLPRARYARNVACRVVQGHLAHALGSLGYTTLPAADSSGIILETSL